LLFVGNVREMQRHTGQSYLYYEKGKRRSFCKPRGEGRRRPGSKSRYRRPLPLFPYVRLEKSNEDQWPGTCTDRKGMRQR